MGTERSLPFLKVLIASTYPEPQESSPYQHIQLFSKIHPTIILPPMSR
jgi:hypothetical protein